VAVIDTLEIADELARDGVFTREQAERLARISARAAAEALVTKADLESGVSAVRADIAALRRDMEALRRDMEGNTTLLRHEFEARLQSALKEQVKWFSGILLAHGITVIGVTVALVKLL
jgi:hypothetical protein